MQLSCIPTARRAWRATTLMALALALASCAEPVSTDGSEPQPPGPGPVPGDSMLVAPQNATVQVGQQIVFTAADTTTQGTLLSGPMEWSVSGDSGAAIDASGVFMSSTAGTYTVKAGRGGKGGRSKVTVNQSGSSLTAVQVSPGSVTVQPNVTFTFSATGRHPDGSDVPVVVDWAATGGTIDTAGRYRAGATTGSFRVVAQQRGGSLADTATITIAAGAPTLAAIEVTPGSVSLQGNASQQFSAVGRMSDGSTSSVSVTWSATGGTVTSGGLYTAGTAAGTFRVIAATGGLADTSSVTVGRPSHVRTSSGPTSTTAA